VGDHQAAEAKVVPGGNPFEQKPGLASRFCLSVVKGAERLNVRYSRYGNPPIYDLSVFPWTRTLEQNWGVIRRELDQVLTRQRELPSFHELTAEVSGLSDEKWKTFMFAAYGLTSRHNIERCPETWRILQCVPGLKTAMFSILEPGMYIPPHKGPYNGVLRLHLGLAVPEPRTQSAIRVDRQLYHWREGEAVVFDDAFEHEAWNRTGGTRVVLFLDFMRPLRFPANFVNWLLLNLAVFTPFLREGRENQKAWERRFYRH
jgi:beta-hydroxylase